MATLYDTSNAEIERFLKEKPRENHYAATGSAGPMRFYWDDLEEVYYFGVRGVSGNANANMVELHRQMQQYTGDLSAWVAVGGPEEGA
jgi:hypothetical protein